MKKAIKTFFQWLLVVVLATLIITTCWHHYMCSQELDKYPTPPYGERILVNGSYMVYDVKGADNDKTIVLLPGLGSTSPVLEFKELSSALSTRYRVITIEPFGYGFSDDTVDERTVSHIASDINSLLEQIGVDQYYLMGHSIAGIYSVYLANQKPDAVLGFIGIDPSVPHQDEYDPVPVIGSTFLNKVAIDLEMAKNFIGINRLIYKLSPMKEPGLTDEENEIMTYLTLNRVGNSTLQDEMDRIDSNLSKVKNLKFPETVPVLNFVASSNTELMPEWEQLHRDVITETEKSKVVVLQGQHYLHQDNLENIVNGVFEWVG